MESRPVVKNAARVRHTARKAGISLSDIPPDAKPYVAREQEQPDIM